MLLALIIRVLVRTKERGFCLFVRQKNIQDLERYFPWGKEGDYKEISLSLSLSSTIDEQTKRVFVMGKKTLLLALIIRVLVKKGLYKICGGKRDEEGFGKIFPLGKRRGLQRSLSLSLSRVKMTMDAR